MTDAETVTLEQMANVTARRWRGTNEANLHFQTGMLLTNERLGQRTFSPDVTVVTDAHLLFYEASQSARATYATVAMLLEDGPERRRHATDLTALYTIRNLSLGHLLSVGGAPTSMPASTAEQARTAINEALTDRTDNTFGQHDVNFHRPDLARFNDHIEQLGSWEQQHAARSYATAFVRLAASAAFNEAARLASHLTDRWEDSRFATSVAPHVAAAREAALDALTSAHDRTPKSVSSVRDAAADAAAAFVRSAYEAAQATNSHLPIESLHIPYEHGLPVRYVEQVRAPASV